MARLSRTILSSSLVALFAVGVPAQTVKVFHPAGPLPSYDVATIKPSDPNQPYSGTTLRRYIANAYGVPIPWGAPATEFAGAQVVGGPAWIDKDKYDIKGKVPDELRVAMEKMPKQEADEKRSAMQQALLADRFHLKVHFETREMQIFEMVPAKGGLKIAAAAPVDGTAGVGTGSGDKLPPGSMQMGIEGKTGTAVLQGRAVAMQLFLNALRGESPDVAGRQIVDMTGFKGEFDLKSFRFSGVPLPGGGGGSGASDPDVPSLSQALEEQLGMKLIPVKGQVEVVVIDSIDRPTEN